MKTQYAIPEVGKAVSITVQSNSDYYFRKSDIVETVLSGVVIANHKMIRPNSFTLRIKCPHVPVREINIKNVVAIDYADGTAASKNAVVNDIQTLTVKGSKGDTYTVVKEGGKMSCNCTGFQFRKTCKHLGLIK